MGRTLIIGGTRFMGYQLVWRLLATGEKVTILNRGHHPDPFSNRVERLGADRTSVDFATVLKGRDFDTVVDFAAYTAVDAQGAVEVLRDRTGHYIFISSGAVYMVQEGASIPCTHPWSESDYVNAVTNPPALADDIPSWRYGIGKREAETILREAWASYGFPITCLRLPVVNGERDPERRLEGYLWRILDGGPVLLPDAGTNQIRQVYSGDVAKAIVGMRGLKSTFGEAFNLSQDEEPTLAELVQLMSDLLGAPLRVQNITDASLIHAGLLPRRVSPFSGKWSSRLNPTRAKELLGFRHEPLAQYLDKIISTWLSYPPTTPPDGYRDREQEIALAMNQGNLSDAP